MNYDSRFLHRIRLLLKKTFSLLLFLALVVTGQAQNNALYFDGNNSYVAANNVSNILTGASELSMEVWINRAANLTESKFILTFHQPDGIGLNRENIILFGINKDGLLALNYNENNGGGNIDLFGTAAIPANVWTHIALTIGEDNSAVAYINGQEELTWSIPTRPVNGGYFSIGQDYDNISVTNDFIGKMDEVRVWNTSRTQEDIRENMYKELVGNETGLVAYYKMTDGSGTTLSDNQTNTSANNGTLMGTVSWTTDFRIPVGDGSSGAPYQIATLENLYWLSQTPTAWDSYFTQIDDIDASATQYWNSGAGWSPIGWLVSMPSNNDPFTGSYEGNNKTISGLYIKRDGTSSIGLFGYVNGGSIKNLRLIDANVTGALGTGALAGMVYTGSMIENCGATGTVYGKGYNTGGLIGNNFQGTINKSYAKVNVYASGQTIVGGLVGRQYGNLTDCYSIGNVIGSNEVGGLVGSLASGSISNSYSSGSVSGTTDVGGLVGKASGTVSNSFWDTESSGLSSSDGGVGKTTSEMQNLSTFTDAGWDFAGESTNGTNDIWNMDGVNNTGYPYFRGEALYAAGSGDGSSEERAFLISTLEHLNNVRLNLGSYYKQIADIDASVTSGWDNGAGFFPIGTNANRFVGSYNGNGYLISGITINRSSTDFVGLFGQINNAATISNLGLTNVNITGSYSTGALVGYVESGNLRNCYSTGIVSGTDAVGGITGQIADGEISLSYSTAAVNGTGDYIGGAIGFFAANVNNSYATGSANGDNYVGGFVGNAYGGSQTINCYSTGTVSGNTNVGGFVGYANPGNPDPLFDSPAATITDSFWDTETSGNSSSGGGTGKTTVQMKTTSTFTNWDFSSVWEITGSANCAVSYPYLLQNTQDLAPGLVLFSNPTDGGIVGEDQAIKADAIPQSLTSGAGASGEFGTIEYKWQQSIIGESSGFSDIPGSNAAVYSPGSLSETTWFKRLARVSCVSDWTAAVESNVVKVTVDGTPPAGYSVSVDQGYINNANKTAASFTFAGAEVGTTINYSISSDGGGTAVTGTGTISTATDQIAGIDVSGLNDGSLTLSVTLTDVAGNIGSVTTDTKTKDVVALTGYTVSIDQDYINNTNKTAASFTFAGAEVGATYNYRISSDGGGTAVTGTGAISTATDQIAGIDVSGLNDGELTLTVTLTDAAGNLGSEATNTKTKDVVAPTGYSVSIDQGYINNLNKIAASFTFSDAEVGSTYSYSISSDGGGTAVTGTGAISTATDQITDIDVSGLNDGTLTLSVVLTDVHENPGLEAINTKTKNVETSSAIITYSVEGPYNDDDEIIITATFSKEIADSPVPQISLSGGNTLTATNMVKSSGTVYTYNYTIASGSGIVTVSLSSGTDLAGNPIESAPASGGTFSLNTPPTAANKQLSTDEDVILVFDTEDFGYLDAEDDLLEMIQIIEWSGEGKLFVDADNDNDFTESEIVVPNQEIARAELNSLMFLPSNNLYGNDFASIIFKVQDGFDYSSDSYTISIDVETVNDPPFLQKTAAILYDEDEAPTPINLCDYFDDVETLSENLQFELISNSNEELFDGVELSSHSLALILKPNASGSATIVIRATDRGGLATDESFLIQVNSVNNSPELVELIPVQYIDDDQLSYTVDLSDYFNDEEQDAESLIYEIVDQTNPDLFSSSSFSNSVLTIIPNAQQMGESVLSISVSDNLNASVETEFKIVVADLNQKPYLINEVNALIDGTEQDTVIIAVWDLFADAEDLSQNLTFEFPEQSDSLVLNYDSLTGELAISTNTSCSEDLKFQIKVTDTEGKSLLQSMIFMSDYFTLSPRLSEIKIDAVRLDQNTPNPVQQVARIGFYLPETSLVSFALFNPNGQLIQWLIEKQVRLAGEHEQQLTVRDLLPGIYYYRLSVISETSGQTKQLSKKMIVR